MKICERTGKPIVELSNSGLNTFNSCPKKFAFRKMIVNFEGERESGVAAMVGDALHQGVQNYMIYRSKSKAIEAMALAHPIEIDNYKPNEYSLEASVTTLVHIIENSDLPAHRLVYFERDGAQVPAIEIAFLVEIEFPTLMFHVRGFIDLIVQNAHTGLFMPVDIKTTTPQGATNMELKYQWDWQVTSYGIPLNILLGNHGDFQTAIFGVIQSDREPKAGLLPYRRHQHDIDAYNYYLLDNCRRIEQYYKDDKYPRGPTSCISFGKACPFMTQCAVDGLEAMQTIINPSRKAGKPRREMDPMFTVRMEGMS